MTFIKAKNNNRYVLILYDCCVQSKRFIFTCLSLIFGNMRCFKYNANSHVSIFVVSATIIAVFSPRMWIHHHKDQPTEEIAVPLIVYSI